MSAAHATMHVVAPQKITVGDSANIEAAFVDSVSGRPIAGADVKFVMTESFDGITGDVLLGHSVTDKSGDAFLAYHPRIAGEH